MKTPSETLHKLVQSLNQSEKRYFNLFTKFLHGEGDGLAYLDLIQHIDKQEKYDELALKKSSGISSNENFKRLKHYATEALQRSLESFHAYSHFDVIILRELARAEILYQKKQFELVIKCVDKAEELAKERNRLVYILACLEWKLRLGSAYLPYFKKARAISQDDILKATNDFFRWMELRRFNIISFSMLMEGNLHPDKKRKKKILEMSTQVKKILGKSKNGYTINMEGFMTLGSCYRLAGDMKLSYEYRKKLVEEIESDKRILFFRAGEYIAGIGNLMNAHINMNESPDVIRCFKKANVFYQKLPDKNKNERVEERFINVTNNFISFLYSVGNYKEVLNTGESVLLGIKKHSFVFQNKLDISLFRHLAYSAFQLGQYRESLKHFNALLKRFANPELSYQLFGLIIYYEMGDRDLLFHKTKSFQYYISKTKSTNPFFKIMVKAFTTYLISASGKAAVRESFLLLLKELKAANVSPDSISDIEEFNYWDWIKQKSEK